jgi:uncharacterized protein YqeY
MVTENQIAIDLKDAIKARDSQRVSCLRLLKTTMKNKQVELGKNLNAVEIQALISSLIRKCREAAQEYRRSGREDLAKKEEGEINILYGYLPKQLSRAEIESVLEIVISESSATSIRDLGKVMKVAMARMAGKAEGKEVSAVAQEILNRKQ